MKRNHKLRVILFSIFAAFAATTGCSQGKGETNPGLAAALLSQSSPTLGGARIGVSSAGLGLDDISRIELMVTGTNIPTPIVQELVRSGDVYQGVLLEIPVGTDRIFTARAYNSADTEIFQGELKDVEIKTDEVTLVALTLQNLNPAPVFGNAAPVISGVTVSAPSVQPGESVNIKAVATDGDGDALTFSWSAPKGSFDAPSAAETNWTAPTDTGFHKITLNVSDVHGATVSLSLNLEVAVGPAGHADVRVGLNNAPSVLNILANPARLDRTETTQITATVSDPDGDSLTYAWTSDCAGNFDDATTLNPNFTVDAAAPYGSCTLTLTVTDDKGGVNTGSLLIHIVEDASKTNHPPVIFDAFQQSLSVEAGKTLVFRVRGKDPEGKALTFTWTAPSGTLGAATETPHGTDATQSEILWTAPACGSDIRLMVKATDADNFATTYEYLSVTVIGAPDCKTNLTIVSVHSDGTQSDNSSQYSDVNADGRFTAFASRGENLINGGTSGIFHVFVHDSLTSETNIVSIASDGTQGNHSSDRPSISADGRFVAFSSVATNLVVGDTNNKNDIFVHDRQTGETTLISIASDGTQANDNSAEPFISADGRFVAFESGANNLVAGSSGRNIYVHDLQTKTTTLISVALDGTIVHVLSGDPSISADGRYVAFTATISHLVIGSTSGLGGIFVHDRLNNTTKQIEMGLNGKEANGGADRPDISADGNFITFDSYASNLVEGDTNGTIDIFTYDLRTETIKMVSLSSSGEQSNGYSSGPSISADGRYVTFASYASNLVENDTNDQSDIFLHDLLTGETQCISLGLDGNPGNKGGFYSSISADGSHVVLESLSTNLVTGDTNDKTDIFMFSLP